MTDKKMDKKMETAEKEAAKHSEETAEKGYDEEALTDQQKEVLDYEGQFEEAAKELQESDDPEDMKIKRQQV